MAIWTDIENALLTADWAAGVTAKAIGAKVGRSAGAVRFQRAALGLPPRRGGTGAARVGDVFTADMTSVSVQVPDELLPPKGKRGAVIREALAMLKALRAAGFEGTAAELGAWLEARR